VANQGLTADTLRLLGPQLRAARKAARLTQADVCLAMGMKSASSRSYLHRLEKGELRNLQFMTVVRYLQACKTPFGKFMLELAQSGALGEAEAEDVRGFTSQKPNEQTKREKARARHEQSAEREARDADIVAKLWLEVLSAMQPLLPPDPTRFMAHYLEAVRGFYRAWKLATRGAVNRDPTLDVQMAFDRIERNAVEHLVPAAVRKMREVVYQRLMAMTPQGGNT